MSEIQEIRSRPKHFFIHSQNTSLVRKSKQSKNFSNIIGVVKKKTSLPPTSHRSQHRDHHVQFSQQYPIIPTLAKSHNNETLKLKELKKMRGIDPVPRRSDPFSQ
mmetsp:Transcript_22934/g.35339  ORF Transcript_22934/g.35339 Transcript_22934/m.35339 type:complete len:105 (+) Transcript_22934:1078-1392(+)